MLLFSLFYCLRCYCRHFLQLLINYLICVQNNSVVFLLPLIRPQFRQTFYSLNIEDCIWVLEFCYASIKATERWAEETKKLLRSLFDFEESETLKREVSCKVIMYDKCNEHNECYNDERNERNKKQWLIPLMMSSDAKDILMQIIWRRNMRSTDL